MRTRRRYDECKRHKRGKPALFRPGFYCIRCNAFMAAKLRFPI